MAVFNPQSQPPNDPNYLGYSKGIEGGFGVDKSGGIALDTAATGITEGVSIIDTGIKDSLKDTIRGTVEKQRDDYTQYLETLKKIAQTNQIPGSDNTGESIMDANASMDVPDGLQAGLDRAKNLAAAGNTGNRINDTLYSANLASAASELRTKYAGYKDYIDSEFSKYSGMNPANAYYKNLMQDINTLAAKKSAKDGGVQTILNNAVTSGDVPNADVIWSLRKAGKITDDEAIHQVYKARSVKAAATAAEAERTARKGDRDDTAAIATRDFAKEMGDNVNLNMGLLQVGTGTQTLKGAVDFLNTMAQHPENVDTKQVQSIVTAMQAKRDEIYQNGMSRASERDSTGQTYATRMGGWTAVKTELEGSLYGLDQYIKNVNDGKFGLGTLVQRQLQGQSQDDQRHLLSDEDMRKTKAFSDAFPTFADVFVKAGIVGNVPEKINTYYNNFRINAALQPDFLSKGKTYTMTDTQNDIDTKLADRTKYSAADVAKIKTEAFNIPKTIGDPKAPIEMKANLARHAFDPASIGVLQNIKMDYTDPLTNRYVPGKYSAFTRMTSPDITDGMDKVRKGVQDGPQLWDNYKNWTQTEFQKLFREDAKMLDNIQEGRLHIGWKTGDGGQPPRMQLLNERGEELAGAPPTPSIGLAQRTVQRINSAMYNLHQVYRKDGEDTNMPILQDMLQTWTPAEKTTGLPSKIMDAIILANKSKLQKMEDTFHPGAIE